MESQPNYHLCEIFPGRERNFERANRLSAERVPGAGEDIEESERRH